MVINLNGLAYVFDDYHHLVEILDREAIDVYSTDASDGVDWD